VLILFTFLESRVHAYQSEPGKQQVYIKVSYFL
jgi:hypothetical protein